MKHSTQRAYAKAKRAYDTAFNAYVKAAGDDFHKSMSDAAFERAMEKEEGLRGKYKIDALASALRKAEDAMVEWMVGVVKRKHPAQAATVESTTKQAMRLVYQRNRVVNMAYRFSGK